MSQCWRDGLFSPGIGKRSATLGEICNSRRFGALVRLLDVQVKSPSVNTAARIKFVQRMPSGLANLRALENEANEGKAAIAVSKPVLMSIR